MWRTIRVSRDGPRNGERVSHRTRAGRPPRASRDARPGRANARVRLTTTHRATPIPVPVAPLLLFTRQGCEEGERMHTVIGVVRHDWEATRLVAALRDIEIANHRISV